MKENPNVEYQSTKKPNMFRISDFEFRASNFRFSSAELAFGSVRILKF